MVCQSVSVYGLVVQDSHSDKGNIVDPKKVVSSPLTLILQEIGEAASSFDTLGGKPFNIAALEGKTCRLRNTTMDSNCASSTLVFSAAVTAFSNGNNLLFPQLDHLSSELMCLPVSNVTVKFLFSIIRAING